MKPKMLVIAGRRWFDKVNGNTYHSTLVNFTNESNDNYTKTSPVTYGYGDSYLETALNELQKEGMFAEYDYGSFRNWLYNNRNISFNMVIDVTRKKDLTT